MPTSVHPGAASAPAVAVAPAAVPVRPLPLPLARGLVLSRAGPLAPLSLAAATARGRILAHAVCAVEPSPASDLSAVDGYAVPDTNPVAAGARWTVRGETPAGTPAAARLAPGETVRVFTGAPLPPGTGCVLKCEDVALHGDVITVLRPGRASHCRRRGENHAAGAEVLAAGTCLGPLELALLATTGHTTVTVFPPPRVAHLVLGSELVAPGATPGPAQTRDANSVLIAALVADAGAQLVGQARVPDELPLAIDAIRRFPAHEVLLLSGGAGHGRYDIACAVLRALGYDIAFRAIDLRPGRPLALASRPGRLAFAMPGNPVSHWATWHLLVAPALRRLSGHAVPPDMPRRTGRIEQAWQLAAEEREVFWPARATAHVTGWSVRPLRFANSGDLAGVAGANALVCAGTGGGRWAPGDRIDFVFCP